MKKNKLFTMVAAAALLLPSVPLASQNQMPVQAARHHKRAHHRRIARKRRTNRRKRKVRKAKKNKKAKTSKTKATKTKSKKSKAKYAWQIIKVPNLTFTKTAQIYRVAKKHGKKTMVKVYVRSLPYTISKGIKISIPSSKTMKLNNKTYYKVSGGKHQRTLYVKANDAEFSWGMGVKRVKVKPSKPNNSKSGNNNNNNNNNQGSGNNNGQSGSNTNSGTSTSSDSNSGTSAPASSN